MYQKLIIFLIISSFSICHAQTPTTSVKKTTPKSVSVTIKEKTKVSSEKVIKTEKVVELKEDLRIDSTKNRNPTPNKVEPTRVYDYTNSDLLVKWHELIFELVEQTQGYSPNVARSNFACKFE